MESTPEMRSSEGGLRSHYPLTAVPAAGKRRDGGRAGSFTASSSPVRTSPSLSWNRRQRACWATAMKMARESANCGNALRPGPRLLPRYRNLPVNGLTEGVSRKPQRLDARASAIKTLLKTRMKLAEKRGKPHRLRFPTEAHSRRTVGPSDRATTRAVGGC